MGLIESTPKSSYKATVIEVVWGNKPGHFLDSCF